MVSNTFHHFLPSLPPFEYIVAQKLISALLLTDDINRQCALTLLILPFIVKAGRTGGKYQRGTAIETVDSFLHLVPGLDGKQKLMEAYQNDAAQTIAKLAEPSTSSTPSTSSAPSTSSTPSTSSAPTKVTVHEYIPPILLGVGPNVEHITSFAVCIADFEYLSDSLIVSADLFFKAVYALDLKYPNRSLTVWSVIQVLFYNIPLTKHFAAVYDFVNDIKERVKPTNTVQPDDTYLTDNEVGVEGGESLAVVDEGVGSLTEPDTLDISAVFNAEISHEIVISPDEVGSTEEDDRVPSPIYPRGTGLPAESEEPFKAADDTLLPTSTPLIPSTGGPSPIVVDQQSSWSPIFSPFKKQKLPIQRSLFDSDSDS